MKVSESTNVQMPLKTVVSLITLVAVGTWAYFGIIERLNSVETRVTLSEADLTKNTEFRIKWPRGELGSLPADAQQDLLIEFMSSQLEHMAEEMESMMSNSVNIKRAQQDLLIEFMSSQLEHMAEEMESMMSNSVNIKRAQQDIERLLNDVEKLKDKLRETNGSY